MHLSQSFVLLFAPAVVTKYQKSNFSHILDQIGTHIKVPHVDYKKLRGGSDAGEERIN